MKNNVRINMYITNRETKRMEVNSVGYGSALTPETQSLYAVKCIKMAQQTTLMAGEILQDVADISLEAMEKFAAEMKKNV